MAVVVIGTLDTKGPEITYVSDGIVRAGLSTLIVDSGILGEPKIRADVTREEVARWAGTDLESVRNAGSRGAAVELMQEGLRRGIRDLYDDGEVQGVICLGGAEGALLGAAAMHELPVGVPKLIVSPSASGRREFGPFMGSSDVTVMHSVIDILGLNGIARSVFDNAVAAIVGMVSNAGALPVMDRPAVGVTMLGQTTPGAEVLVSVLDSAGFEAVIFHANGVGGPAMDALARDGLLRGVVEFTVSELANTVAGGLHATGESRLQQSVSAGVPVLLVPGAADFVNQGPLESVDARFNGRAKYRHNPVATLVRLSADEMHEVGAMIAERLNGATAPAAVVVPTKGLSLIGIPGGPIADEEADAALVVGLRETLRRDIPITLVDDHINSPSFAREVGLRFVDMMSTVDAVR